MEIGEKIAFLLEKTMKVGTFVSTQGEDLIVAVEEQNKRVHHRIAHNDVMKFVAADEKELNEFYENNFDALFKSCQETLAALLPGVKIEQTDAEKSVFCREWGVTVSPSIIQVKRIGQITEKAGWLVSYEDITVSRFEEDVLYDIIEVGRFPNVDLASEEFVRCIFERKIQNFCENRAF